MLGAIVGDVIGSVYEFDNYRHQDFPIVNKYNKFTDDTVLTIAIMDWIVNANPKDIDSVNHYIQKWGRKYPNAGYGNRFRTEYLYEEHPHPYFSYGNGAAMRVSPVSFVANSIDKVIELSDFVTSVTHNHPEGIKGARAIAIAIFMAWHGYPKEDIKEMAIAYYPEIKYFEYDDLLQHYRFNETCQDTCPQALYCFLISNSFEECLRISVSIGGDTDTLCAMSCAIAEAFYKEIPVEIRNEVLSKLDKEMLDVIEQFDRYVANLDEDKSIELTYDLQKFIDASDNSIDLATKELSEGYKESHYMWYIFPQLRGLGHSELSYNYGLSGLGEARAYYANEILGKRLTDLCKVLLSLDINEPIKIFGELDSKKLRSSMTLFYEATHEQIFLDVLKKYFDGMEDPKTLDRIKKW